MGDFILYTDISTGEDIHAAFAFICPQIGYIFAKNDTAYKIKDVKFFAGKKKNHNIRIYCEKYAQD